MSKKSIAQKKAEAAIKKAGGKRRFGKGKFSATKAVKKLKKETGKK